MAKRPIQTPEALRQLLRCDPDAGKLFWLERTPEMFVTGVRPPEGRCRRFNNKWAGKEAFTATNDYGYRVGNLGGKVYRAHRVIWAVIYGKWPLGEIDHINGVPDDNRLENLRDVSHQENLQNQKLRSSNTSGHNGVAWCSTFNKWRCQLMVNGESYSFGYHDHKEDAIAAIDAGFKQHGFHENHGRSA